MYDGLTLKELRLYYLQGLIPYADMIRESVKQLRSMTVYVDSFDGKQLAESYLQHIDRIEVCRLHCWQWRTPLSVQLVKASLAAF